MSLCPLGGTFGQRKTKTITLMFNPSIPTTMRLQFGELNITPKVVNRLNELDYTVEDLKNAIVEHKSEGNGEPSLYVGTYGKYNDGSLCGLWVDLSSFDDYDDFITFCMAIHADEEDPELMFQDFEGFPRQWYSEGSFFEEDFDHIKEYCDLCDQYSQDAVDDYMELHDELDSFDEAYCGQWDTEEDFARSFIEGCYDLDKMMGNLSQYFDYEALGREMFMYDYSMGANGYVFRAV